MHLHRFLTGGENLERVVLEDDIKTRELEESENLWSVNR